MQNTQPTAQPTCVDTHRPSRGSSTLSTVWPSFRRHQQARRAVLAGMFGLQRRQAGEFGRDRGQRLAQRQRQEILDAPLAARPAAAR